MPKRETALRYVDRLLEAAPIGVIALDSRGKIVDCNRKATELFGTPAHVLAGRAFDSLVPEEQREQLVAALAHACLSDRDVSLPIIELTGDGSGTISLRDVP